VLFPFDTRDDCSDQQSLLRPAAFGNAIEHGGDDVTVTVGTLESGYSSTAEGTGFGLAIVADIAAAHGWEIRATDSESGGVRFEITGVEG
jgi:signal transduction histidine kinase